MRVTFETNPDESAFGEWLAALTIVFASIAFAALMRWGPTPTMDRARVGRAAAAPETWLQRPAERANPRVVPSDVAFPD